MKEHKKIITEALNWLITSIVDELNDKISPRQKENRLKELADAKAALNDVNNL